MDYKKIAILGGALVGAGALAYLVLRGGSKDTVSAGGKVYTKEDIMKVLRTTKKELFTVVMQISMMAQQMKQYSQGRLDYDIKEFIFSYPAISQEIQNATDKALKKNNISEADFQYNCEVTYKNDKEIQTFMQGIKQMVDNAADGKEVDIKAEIPEFLTSDTLLIIIERIMKETTKQMQQIFKRIKDQYGELNLNDPRIAQQLQTLQADDIKTTIFAEYNLEDFEDPAQKIVSYATQKFAQDQPEFQQKMMQLELKQRKSMEVIMQNPSADGLVDKIFDEQAPAAPSGMGGAFQGFHAQKRKNQQQQKEKEVVQEVVKAEEPAKAEETEVVAQKVEEKETEAVQNVEEKETEAVQNVEEKETEAVQNVEEKQAEKVEEQAPEAEQQEQQQEVEKQQAEVEQQQPEAEEQQPEEQQQQLPEEVQEVKQDASEQEQERQIEQQSIEIVNNNLEENAAKEENEQN